jgi:hypothetical protein
VNRRRHPSGVPVQDRHDECGTEFRSEPVRRGPRGERRYASGPPVRQPHAGSRRDRQPHRAARPVHAHRVHGRTLSPLGVRPLAPFDPHGTGRFRRDQHGAAEADPPVRQGREHLSAVTEGTSAGRAAGGEHQPAPGRQRDSRGERNGREVRLRATAATRSANQTAANTTPTPTAARPPATTAERAPKHHTPWAPSRNSTPSPVRTRSYPLTHSRSRAGTPIRSALPPRRALSRAAAS